MFQRPKRSEHFLKAKKTPCNPSAVVKAANILIFRATVIQFTADGDTDRLCRSLNTKPFCYDHTYFSNISIKLLVRLALNVPV